jgi:hypothetical protein
VPRAWGKRACPPALASRLCREVRARGDGRSPIRVLRLRPFPSSAEQRFPKLWGREPIQGFLPDKQTRNRASSPFADGLFNCPFDTNWRELAVSCQVVSPCTSQQLRSSQAGAKALLARWYQGTIMVVFG